MRGFEIKYLVAQQGAASRLAEIAVGFVDLLMLVRKMHVVVGRGTWTSARTRVGPRERGDKEAVMEGRL
jgi:hypothetical protein